MLGLKLIHVRKRGSWCQNVNNGEIAFNLFSTPTYEFILFARIYAWALYAMNVWKCKAFELRDFVLYLRFLRIRIGSTIYSRLEDHGFILLTFGVNFLINNRSRISVSTYWFGASQTAVGNSFYPRPVFGLRVLSLPACVCVRVSVNHEFVRPITHQPFKLGSPNLDQRCKRPWLRALLFCGMIDRDLQGQIEPQSPQIWTPNLLHFELVHAITHHQFKLQFPNLEQNAS